MVSMERKSRVLVVEDEQDIREGLKQLLESEYEVALAPDGIEGLKSAVLQPPDLILLDIMMPNLDGYKTVEVLRKDPVTAAIPVIMVTALKSTEERIKVFRAGADDYLAKPFDSDELMARIEAKLKRGYLHALSGGASGNNKKIECGNLTMDLDSFEVRVAGETVHLSLLEFRLVKHLVENRGKLCSRQQIVQAVWDDEQVSGRLLDPHVLSIRRKLDKFDHQIASVYGGGYILKLNQPGASASELK